MVTRAGVAKRLGISIASVRRMEGHELHPQTDERGVHQFDAGEVEDVARTVREGGSVLADAPFADAELREARDRASRLERELAAARDALGTALARSSQLERQTDDLRTTAIEALQLVHLALGADVPYGVRQVLRTLQRER